ncbi:MAG: iron complex transport system ATP-binding protein [Phycisphaerales bacterium]|jgi:iron complex transport system ATP-binding protein
MPLKCESISHAFHPGHPVLQRVSAEFVPGALTAVVGPNGAGKTTLLRVLAGLLNPGQGEATLGGQPVRSIGARARAARMAFVPQRPEIGFGYTVEQVVGFGRFAAGRGGGEKTGSPADPSVAEALKAVGLTDRARESFLELSVGQQQRAVLARALAQLAPDMTEKILLADEPVSAMDPRHAQRALDLIRQRTRSGLAAVVVLHDLTLARRYADRGLVLDEHGEVAASGTASETLNPEVLGEVFGMPFVEVMVEGGPAILPSGLPAR